VRLRVLYFAALAECAGCRSEVVEVGDDSTVASLWAELRTRHPALVDLPYRPAAACDRTWSDWDTGLAAVSEVAFVPPVSGG
jgi:molybdopterin converting factor small subunit